ncbi:HelD family protein [Longispora albida]|uniref:HelD family protein n=1 Tax=Longispora albida TaxID=203523 RepID=UPI00037F6EE9|nr:ATP-binding domain-containing protein [Longispora albida]
MRQEQDYLTMLYARLDELRRQAGERLAVVLDAPAGGTLQNRSERDSASTMYTDRVAEFGALEHGLCFGRLDLDSGQRTYIGRVGLYAAGDGHEQLLMDWRAPAARSFYLATAADPLGVRRRRHIRTRQREVIGLDDEVLDLEAARGGDTGGITGEAALLAALDARRTGTMRDIVETIQAEQDEIIRSGLGGVMVVQGGPGTGKTAVALHRAAYLLYTHREQLSRHGVLIVGPNPTFLHYISQVLPTLAETGVLLRTPGDLFPGVSASGAESPATAELKGRAVMAEVIAAAIADREEVPHEPVELRYDREPLWLEPSAVEEARDLARGSGKLHNLAREIFAGAILGHLAHVAAERIGADPLGGDNLLTADDIAEITSELAADAEVEAALDWLWPDLTPERLLADLFTDEYRIEAATPGFTPAERALLSRKDGEAWTVADVALLDEAAEQLGSEEPEPERPQLAYDQEYAEGVIDIALGSQSFEFEDQELEFLLVTDVIDAGRLAERQEDTERLTAAERAAADRTWAFGHIIVDEAQELSPMMWRLLMRRSPNKSMTLAGDVAQTGDLAGASSWQDALGPFIEDRWRLSELTVSYRTPAEIMRLADAVLKRIDPGMSAPEPVRSTGIEPWTAAVEPADLAAVVAERAAAEAGEGLVGVLCPESLVGTLRAAVAEPAMVLSVRDAKGLEFDSVLLADPAGIIAESPRGYNDLYVALTRSTRRLGIVHPGPLPEVLAA